MIAWLIFGIAVQATECIAVYFLWIAPGRATRKGIIDHLASYTTKSENTIRRESDLLLQILRLK
jgi:hypothetical protein